MDRNIKNKGREKRVTSGGGNAKRRGTGVNTGGPVGSSSGYSKRKQGNRPSSSQSTFRPQSSSSTGRRPFSFKKVLMWAIIIIVGYFILKNMFGSSDGGLGSLTEGLMPSTSEQSDQTSVYDGDVNEGVLNTSVDSEAREKRTVIMGAGQDVHTIMIYMCGTDLESRAGMATSDLQEILAADISDKVNIIVETGGTKTWKNDVVSNKTNQRFKCTNDGLALLEKDLGKKTMTDPDTLTDFISYCKDNFKANRYSLILWDHGGGSTQGYGYDEYVPSKTMTLGQIDKALDNADCKFDLVGFDACLMATYETAMMLDKYADYFIASEETEPGIGWYYTDWISALSSNTSMSTPNIGKNIIDDFVAKCYQANRMDKTTLSIIDLAEFSGTVPQKFKAFASTTAELIDSDNYKIVSDARNGSREFGPANALDQIDLIHLAQNIATPEADELIKTIRQCVKYNKTSDTISNANGVSIYFPYDKLSKLGPMLSTYDEIGMDLEYSECLKSFANLEAGGQLVSSGSPNPMGSLLGSLGGSSSSSGMDMIGNLLGGLVSNGGIGDIIGNVIGGDDEAQADNWVDTEQMQQSQEYYENNYIDSANIVLAEKDGGYVIDLSDKEWDVVQSINLNVFLDDGDGFIDLGMDNVYEFDDDGDLMVDFDGTWIAINGQIVSYYFVSEEYKGDDYTITGRVPAMLNDELVNLMLVFTDDVPYGQVVGARKLYIDNPDTVAKGLMEIEDGDKIDFLCDYYTYDEDYDNSFYLGEQMTINSDLVISNVDVGDVDCKVTYQIKDIYNNTYWTPVVNYQ